MICEISHYVTASAPPQAGPYSGNAHGDGQYPTLTQKEKYSFLNLST
jgi:hypothetical protein